MSTLKVDNLQTASGGSNSNPEQIFQGRAKAWVNFNVSGTNNAQVVGLSNVDVDHVHASFFND